MYTILTTLYSNMKYDRVFNAFIRVEACSVQEHIDYNQIHEVPSNKVSMTHSILFYMTESHHIDILYKTQK